MTTNEEHINQIAEMLTEDPDIFFESDNPSWVGSKGKQVDKSIYDRWGNPGTKLYDINSVRGVMQYYQNAGLPQSKAPIKQTRDDKGRKCWELLDSQWSKLGPKSTSEKSRMGL